VKDHQAGGAAGAAGRTLVFELADPDRHAALLHDWLNRPHVLPWWGPERTLEETRDYVAGQRALAYLDPWIVSATDPVLPFGYVETYRAGEDPLADHFPLGEHDRGWHVLVGPPEVIGSGLPRRMGRTIMDRLFAEPGVERVVCEPDIRNERMHGFCRALGYEALATLDLPDKRAILFGLDRAAYERGRT
jgi:RimJ/RimL family protein N-acetyltransferase